jgi:hypothetical protein
LEDDTNAEQVKEQVSDLTLNGNQVRVEVATSGGPYPSGEGFVKERRGGARGGRGGRGARGGRAKVRVIVKIF